MFAAAARSAANTLLFYARDMKCGKFREGKAGQRKRLKAGSQRGDTELPVVNDSNLVVNDDTREPYRDRARTEVNLSTKEALAIAFKVSPPFRAPERHPRS